MTTTPHMTSIETNNSQTWKWASGILAVVLALSLIGIGVESYFFYRAIHPEAVIARPSLVPSLPHPSSPNLNSVSGPDDWDVTTNPLAPGGPWDQLNHLHQQMDQLFNDTVSQFPPIDDAALAAAISSPNLDVREEKDHYTVRADMPGADKDSLKVNVEGRLLTIAGDRTSVQETKDNDKVVRSERSMAHFERAIQLPGAVKANAVDAKYDNGVLTLTLPKADQATAATQVPIH
jgi:HSP20 family protein